MQADHIISSILNAHTLYDVLNVDKDAGSEEIRKAFLYRSKFAHPGMSREGMIC